MTLCHKKDFYKIILILSIIINPALKSENPASCLCTIALFRYVRPAPLSTLREVILHQTNGIINVKTMREVILHQTNGIINVKTMRFELGIFFESQICHNYYTSKCINFASRLNLKKKDISYYKKIIHFPEVNFTGIPKMMVFVK